MSRQESCSCTFIPYEESDYPQREQRMRELTQARPSFLPDGFTLKRCQASIGIERLCGKPASWVRVSESIGLLLEMAVCEEHKTEEDSTTTPVAVEAERVITHREGEIHYNLMVRDDLIGELTIVMWLNQEDGHLYALLFEERPSPMIRQLRERKANRKEARLDGSVRFRAEASSCGGLRTS